MGLGFRPNFRTLGYHTSCHPPKIFSKMSKSQLKKFFASKLTTNVAFESNIFVNLKHHPEAFGKRLTGFQIPCAYLGIGGSLQNAIAKKCIEVRVRVSLEISIQQLKQLLRNKKRETAKICSFDSVGFCTVLTKTIWRLPISIVAYFNCTLVSLTNVRRYTPAEYFDGVCGGV